jgi:hypothetical protein
VSLVDPSWSQARQPLHRILSERFNHVPFGSLEGFYSRILATGTLHVCWHRITIAAWQAPLVLELLSNDNHHKSDDFARSQIIIPGVFSLEH